MLEIQEHIATEELLKMYFFKLYERKNEFGDLYFLEDRLNVIINSKTLSQMNSKELFECININNRWGMRDVVDGAFFIPSKFYFINDIEHSNKTIFEHSFLYTNFKLIDGLNLYKAEIGLGDLGCDLINANGVVLKTVTPNLYDNGYYEIKVLSKNYPIILLTISDENNGDWLSLYSLNDNQLIEIEEIDDKILILDFLKFGYSEILGIASAEIKDDSEILLAAININSNSLNFASDRLRNDKSIVLKAVSQDGDSLGCASDELKNDREVVLVAVSQDGESLEYASDKLKNDREVVGVAVLNGGHALRYSSDALRNDKIIVLLAVSSYGRALKYASDELKNDQEVVLLAVSDNGEALMYASDELKNDKEVVLKAVSKNGKTLKYASNELRNDKEVVIAAVSNNGYAIEYVGEKLKNNSEILAIVNVKKNTDFTNSDESISDDLPF